MAGKKLGMIVYAADDFGNVDPNYTAMSRNPATKPRRQHPGRHKQTCGSGGYGPSSPT